MSDDIYYKQKELYNPHGTQPIFHIYGAGSIGSHVVLGLAKMGFENIHVYDYDTVEAGNTPAQIYGPAFIGVKKTDALSGIVQTLTGKEITKHDICIKNDFEPEIGIANMHIVCFDNISGRKTLAELLMGFPLWFIDGRIGGFNYEIYTTRMDNYQEYMKTLEGGFAEEPCGGKCLWGVNTLIASKILGTILNILKRNNYSPIHKGNFLSHITINEEEKQGGFI